MPEDSLPQGAVAEGGGLLDWLAYVLVQAGLGDLGGEAGNDFATGNHEGSGHR
jgi:hypothetical protein